MNFEKKKGHPSSVILAELFPQNVLFPEGRYVVYPVGVQLILFPFIVLGNVDCDLKIRWASYDFWTSKMFYPPKGDT